MLYSHFKFIDERLVIKTHDYHRSKAIFVAVKEEMAQPTSQLHFTFIFFCL